MSGGAAGGSSEDVAQLRGELERMRKELAKAKGEVAFADKLCEEVRFCERYVDPLDLQREQEKERVKKKKNYSIV